MTTAINWHDLGRVGEKIWGLILFKYSRMWPSTAVVCQGLLRADPCYAESGAATEEELTG